VGRPARHRPGRPREIGARPPRTNPEQLSAAGYAACFQSALLRLAAGRKLVGSRAAIDREQAAELMLRAHEICPYSRATRGNIEVTLTVGGAPIERAAA
jgi:organic hydroperoxide reductase OsmC/OhrA